MATKRQMVEREEDIQAALRSGQSVADFSQVLAAKHGCSKNSILRQYRAIITQISNIQKETRDELRAELMLRSEHLYKMAVDKGNIKNAIDAVNQQAKLSGLYQPESKDKEEKPQAPIFQFKRVDNSKSLAVVPEDDNDRNKTSE